jgi:transposase
MNVNHYIGFDVHKKTINYCVKMADGQIVEEGKLRATHDALRQWAGRRREPWRGAMEATLFSGWIYDTLKPFAAELQIGHPAMMKAIGASKKKNDKIDARKTADLVRCNLLPECYVAPAEMRELRRLLRYRNVVVAQAVRIKNKMSGLLMEVGAEYNKRQLHGKKYFTELLGNVEEVPESVKDLLRLSQGALEVFEATQRQLLNRLQKEPQLVERLAVLKSIRGVGEVTALTWALEICDPQRFRSIADAVSYCGLTSALDCSADKQHRGPVSKQRNGHLQTVLIEAAKLAQVRHEAGQK